MTQKLTWSKNDVANTDTHLYRIKTIDNINRVIYRARGTSSVFQSSEFDSVEAAKQWAENYNNEYGVSDE